MKNIYLILLFVSISSAQFWENTVDNFDFTADANWTKGVGWSISSGVASSDGSQVATSDLSQLSVLRNGGIIGDYYRIKFKMTAFSAGTISIRSNASTIGSGIASLGWHIYNPQLLNTGSDYIVIRASADFVGSVDSVFVLYRIAAIYIDTGGSNTAHGESDTPIADVNECNTRGYYDGGIINLSAEAHTGTMKLTADVVINGNGATIDAIDCGDNAVTLNGLDFYITNLSGTNYIDNRTFTATQDKGFKEHSKFKRFKSLK